jgi:hypothetical protein
LSRGAEGTVFEGLVAHARLEPRADIATPLGQDRQGIRSLRAVISSG